jgi:general secretion pathway protein H
MPRGVHARGFSLLELLVVLVILAIMAATAMLSLGDFGGDDQVDREARRLLALLQLAGEETLLQGRDFGIYVEEDRYRFLVYDRDTLNWRPLDTDPNFRERILPESVFFSLVVEDQEVVLEPFDDETELEPQVAILSSGELTEFELYLGREFSDEQMIIKGLADGSLELEKVDPDAF